MRNIFLFIRRYFGFLFFLVLQIIALSILFRYNKLHEAVFMRAANEITGGVSTKYSGVEDYFKLKKVNEQLARENNELRNRLRENYETADTIRKAVQDTIPYDTLGHYAKYVYYPAKVVNNSIVLQNNYFTIHRGENQGVHKGMGVISPLGAAGVVVNTSNNYAVVMSLLNRQSSISCKLKKTGESGPVKWDGVNPSFITMFDVPQSVKVAIGDTVVTSQYSYAFPKGIMMGTVSEVLVDKTSNFFNLKLKIATNFYNLEYVNVVENLQKDEQRQLEEATLKK